MRSFAPGTGRGIHRRVVRKRRPDDRRQNTPFEDEATDRKMQ
jgi:hypothetical protein